MADEIGTRPAMPDAPRPTADDVSMRDAPRTPVGAVANREGSYVDWPCALAGATVAAALSFVLMAFGSGIGLSLVSPWPGNSATGTTVVLTATLWTAFAHIAAFGAGGYLTGRMRRPWLDATPDEVQFRDGAHGILVWAIGVTLGAFILASAASGMIRSSAQGAASAVSGVTQETGSSAATTAAIDALFRPTNQRPDPSADSSQVRAEAGRILASAVASNQLAPADRTYLAQLISARTGLSQQDAEVRINQVIASARATADQVRVGSIMAAFLAAATLLLAAAAAWSAATMGGSHREQGTVWRGLRQMPVPTALRRSS